MLMTGSGPVDAERAFTRVSRSRTRAALGRWLRREPAESGRLRVYDDATLRPRPAGGIRAIPLEAIRGTLEPGRAIMFDWCFRPAATARSRWERLWLAERRGEVLPPISVIAVDGSYVIRDGHHRVSVARARGASTIHATVEAAWQSAAGQAGRSRVCGWPA